ncbi:MAG TPA: crosslink repair DNA glycosylase YcaQ family protein [Chthoniobacterales bacterium]|nr:crosslink repair DNA glycosylase YcaQ family protein [Chthoniobacterales bacterium]
MTHRHLLATCRRIGMLQIDSVNVLVRAHYLPLFSRLGPYQAEFLDELSYKPKKRRFFEYWGHEACLLPLESFPFLRWRMDRARNFDGVWGRIARFARSNSEFIEKVYNLLADHGPAGGGEIAKRLAEERPRVIRGWWGWTDSKIALEFLVWCGRITIATRRNFERVYDLTDRVIPAELIAQPAPSPEEAQRQLLRIAARALGVATEIDLRDYFRLSPRETRLRISELVESGELTPVTVENWNAYLHRDSTIPRQMDAAALISPFDPLVWERRRPERVFDFRYRIGIYTPAHKREHGYYVLPFLMGDKLVARVDLKADRKNSDLQVLSASEQPLTDPAQVAEALAMELRILARWLHLERISVRDRGSLSKLLHTAIQSRAVGEASPLCKAF